VATLSCHIPASVRHFAALLLGSCQKALPSFLTYSPWLKRVFYGDNDCSSSCLLVACLQLRLRPYPCRRAARPLPRTLDTLAIFISKVYAICCLFAARHLLIRSSSHSRAARHSSPVLKTLSRLNRFLLATLKTKVMPPGRLFGALSFPTPISLRARPQETLLPVLETYFPWRPFTLRTPAPGRRFAALLLRARPPPAAEPQDALSAALLPLRRRPPRHLQQLVFQADQLQRLLEHGPGHGLHCAAGELLHRDAV
jgi:hypothetical protein